MSCVEITPFPGDKRIALTTSWDDGRVYDRRLVAAFNEWGLKGTFNLNSGLLLRNGTPLPEESGKYLDASEVQVLFAGHEVAIHTVNHPWLTRLDETQIALEVLDDRRALENLVGYPVRGMAYPFGGFDRRVLEILRGLGLSYARTTANQDPCFPPADPLAWGTTTHCFQETPQPLTDRFERLYGSGQRARGQVFFVWGHSYEFADRKDWGALERLFKPLAGKPDVWYCTNIELFDYLAARQRLVIAANRRSAFNPSALAVTVRIGKKVVEVPAGQTIPLPAP